MRGSLPNTLVFPYVWRVHTRLPERFGTPCRILLRARRMNTILVEFEDGYKVLTSGNYLRKRKI
jgi:hypothetical protein